MKVLYALRYAPVLTETFVYREIAALGSLGVDVSIAALGQRADGALQDEGPTVPVAWAPRGVALGPAVADSVGKFGVLASWQATASTPLRTKDRLRGLWLAAHAKAVGATHIHAHFAGEAAVWGSMAAQLTGLPLSVTVHAADLHRPHRGLKSVLEAADVTTVCAFNRDLLRSRYGVDAHLVHCGVDPGRYRRVRHAARQPLRIVTVARNRPKKGLGTLLEAVDAMGDRVTTRMVSDVPEAWTRPGLEVGLVPPSEVPRLLEAADVFVLPCRVAADGDRDGVPVAIMEAMATGLPVISCAVGGVGELVDDTVGWLVPPDDPPALRRALEEAMDPAARSERGAAAASRIAGGWTAIEGARALHRVWS
jgi:colanic acid/amylovoran biosynthesis glycosyltransferase